MGESDGDDYVGQAGAEQSNQEKRQYQRREGQKHIAQTHQQHVDSAADKPSQATYSDAQRQHQCERHQDAAQR